MVYQEMALVYDQLMQDAPYDKWLELTKNVLRSHPDVNSIADLGCGTGKITVKLAKAGYTVTGIDYSEEMLSIAQQRMNEEQVAVQWLHQDLRSLQGLSNMDAAVSYCDVINYITEEDELKTVFKRIHDMLKPGGIFIFDVHSMYHAENNFIGQTFADVTDKVSYIWFCSPGEETGEMYHDITFFVKSGNQYERFDETHHQHTYSLDFYEQLLEGAGFKLNYLLGDFSAARDHIEQDAERIFFIAEKYKE